jgi:hypothetical protein
MPLTMIWIELIKRFGFGKRWVSAAIGRHYDRRHVVTVCYCGHENTPLRLLPIRHVDLNDVGVIRIPRTGKDLYVWAGACSGCDRVYFGLATRESPSLTDEERWRKQQADKG